MRRKTQDEVINEFKNTHGSRYDYSNVIYKNAYTHVKIICRLHGPFKQQPRAHKNGQGCPKCTQSNKWVPYRDTASFIKRAKEVHGDQYDYSNTEYIKTMEKVTITCKIHGPFQQLANSHLNGRGCRQCANNQRKTTELFIKQAQIVHCDRYDYSCVEYVSAANRVIIICRKHGAFEQKPSCHLSGQGCPKCGIDSMRTRLSKPERDFIKECAIIHNKKYDYTNTRYRGRSSLITIICPIHGEFEQRASEHLRGYGCPQCAGNQPLSTDEFIYKAKNVHGNRYNYPGLIYTRSKDVVEVECQQHGRFKIVAGYHLHGGGCPICTISTDQNSIAEFVSSLVNVEINNRAVIHPYELDIFVPQKLFAVEFNGNYWHSYNTTESSYERNRHKIKADLAQKSGIKLLQINSHEWHAKKPIVQSMIRHQLQLSNNRLYARNCDIIRVNNSEVSTFFGLNHISGHRQAKINYGLYHDGKLTSAINFIKNNDTWEIIRYATLLNTVVVGGLGKLMAKFIRDERPETITTFADNRYGDGAAYLKVGFKKLVTTKPGYIYLDSNCNPAGSRVKFQKHKLEKLLTFFDSKLTEAENMFANGYRRMWDAGHKKFVLKL